MNILDKELYERVKKQADSIYKKPSAYKSGYIVSQYKKQGGKYSGKKPKDGLTNWFASDWTDIGGLEYPVYRPTKKISNALTVSEIDKKNLQKQIKLKQKIKGTKNLPPFVSK